MKKKKIIQLLGFTTSLLIRLSGGSILAFYASWIEQKGQHCLFWAGILFAISLVFALLLYFLGKVKSTHPLKSKP